MIGRMSGHSQFQKVLLVIVTIIVIISTVVIPAIVIHCSGAGRCHQIIAMFAGRKNNYQHEEDQKELGTDHGFAFWHANEDETRFLTM
jgi:hypothetical protein